MVQIKENLPSTSKENTWMPPAIKEITARHLEDIPRSKPVATANLLFRPPTQEGNNMFLLRSCI